MNLELEDEHAPSVPAYSDPRTGRTYSLSEPRWHSDDGLPLMITPLPGIGRGDIRRERARSGVMRRRFPFPIPDPVSMGEGCTPLVERRMETARARSSSSNGFRRPAASKIAAPRS